MDPFDAPIPGQSLTDEPKNAPWEHPPKYVHMNDALEFIFNQLTQPTNMAKTVSLIDKGVPPEALADVVLFTGFSQGKWTPDLMLMMKNIVTVMFISIAQRAGVGKTTPVKYKRNKNFDNLIDIQGLNLSGLDRMAGFTPAQPTPQPQPSSGGFLTRG